MRIIFFLLFSFFTSHGFSQAAILADSTAKKMIASLDVKNAKPFNTFYDHQDSVGLYKRMDSIKCAYVFSETYFAYGRIVTCEWYFNSADSLQAFYKDGIRTTNHVYPGGVVFENLQQKHLAGKPVRTASFTRRQAYSNGCIRPPRRQARKAVENRLKHSQKILTYTDHVKGTTKVSIELAPKHPWFFIVDMSGGGF